MKKLGEQLFEEVAGMNYVMEEFNFDKCMDFMKVYPSRYLSVN